ncbi:hypothetical protein PV417_22190 [Streptomyces sp. ME19-03-3]|nr:hypothetical protein [Streptomyces sp. ME19-03-3]
MNFGDIPLRGSGICFRCQRHTNDGLVHIIEGLSGPGGRVVYCADRKACDQRRAD